MGKSSRKKGTRGSEVAEGRSEAPRNLVTARPRHLALICAALIVLTLLVFGRAYWNGFIDFDDADYITKNAVVQRGLTAEGVRYAFISIYPYYFQPLVWLSFELDCTLFGANAGAMHLENVLLHGIVAALLFLFLKRNTGRTWPSAAVAALWAVHPLRVESIAWTVERKDVLSGVFFMLTLMAYARYVRQRSAGRYALMLAMFALALMSKVTMVSVPLILLTLNWWPFNRIKDLRTLKTAAIESLSPLILTIPIALAALAGQKGAIAPLPMTTRLAAAAYGVCAYLGKTILPAGLAIMYPYQEVGLAALGWAVLALAISAVVWQFRTTRPYLLTGWGWYLFALAPVSGVVQTGMQSIADRFTYIPSIGLFIAVVWFVADLRAVTRAVATAAAVIAIAVWSILSFRYVGVWRDTLTLFGHAADVTTDNSVAHMIMGNALMAQNRIDAANNELAEAVRASKGAALPLAAQGAAFVQQKRYADAVDPLRKAAEADPNAEPPHINLAIALARTGHAAEAEQHLASAEKLDPSRDIDILAARGNVALALNNPDGAIAAFQQVLKARPSASAWNDLASAYATKDDFADAERAYRQAIRLDPKNYDARMNLGAMLSRAGRNDEALASVREAAQNAPDSIEPRVYLALIEAQLGRHADAANDATAAQQIDPQKANEYFTNALHIPPRDTNLADFVATMRAR
jgi:tetratricopeptide (TPR) repeat protein